MRPKPVIVFGSVPLATWVIGQILRHPDLCLLGVVCKRESRRFEHHGLDEPCVFEFARTHNIRTLELETAGAVARKVGGVGGVSVRFHRILSREVLLAFEHDLINLHGGELPRFRGVNYANHVIIEGLERGAATIHYIDEGVDTGDIIHRSPFDIGRADTAYDVFLKTQLALQQGFTAIVDGFASGDLPRTRQAALLARGEKACTYRRGDLVQYQRLSSGLSEEEIDRRARAFSFPRHEPAFFLFRNRRVYAVPEGW